MNQTNVCDESQAYKVEMNTLPPTLETQGPSGTLFANVFIYSFHVFFFISFVFFLSRLFSVTHDVVLNAPQVKSSSQPLPRPTQTVLQPGLLQHFQQLQLQHQQIQQQLQAQIQKQQQLQQRRNTAKHHHHHHKKDLDTDELPPIR